jgi:hypothetical protein
MHYETFEPQINPRDPNPWILVKRVDLCGKKEYNKVECRWVFTPHVHDPTYRGGIREARPDEIPLGGS